MASQAMIVNDRVIDLEMAVHGKEDDDKCKNLVRYQLIHLMMSFHVSFLISNVQVLNFRLQASDDVKNKTKD
jgi:hypothetical protein